MHFARPIVWIFVSVALFFYTGKVCAQTPSYQKFYNQAEKLANAANPTDETDAQALAAYKQAINILESGGGKDPLFLLNAYINTGSFLQVLGRSADAIPFFKKAFGLKSAVPHLADSLLFRPLVYCGNSYYLQDDLDSAQQLYNKARVIAEKYPQVSEIERLYNTLGVIAHATGNYGKSIIYYQKAIAVLADDKQLDKALLVAYKSNLASAYRKLKRYDEALELYKEALSYKIETDKLNHNIGAVYLAMANYPQAVIWLNKVKYQNQKKLNDLARAYWGQNDRANAQRYLDMAFTLNKKSKPDTLNSDNGITHKYKGDLYIQKNEPHKALVSYQRALINLLGSYRSNDIYNNPGNFTEAFNSVPLLETLLAKAKAFELLSNKTGSLKDMDAGLQTYSAFYQLADHVQQFYETDESRLLISDRKFASRQAPIAMCLRLYQRTKNKKYIEKAFLLDEENKANTLLLSRQEAQLKSASHIPAALLSQELVLKEKITRAALLAAEPSAAQNMTKLRRDINENSVKLLAVQQKISGYMQKQGIRIPDTKVNLAEFQKIIPEQTAVLSYHMGRTQMLCFVIDRHNFNFFVQTLPATFGGQLASFSSRARQRTGNSIRTMKASSGKLYNTLVTPASRFLAEKNDLMVIPDDEMNYLPFEFLIDGNGQRLLEQFTVTYNYSCAILQNSKTTQAKYNNKLGMAPFSRELPATVKGAEQWAQLPSSGKEIATMGGKSYYNAQATKRRFLNAAPAYQLIHLATHAYVNDKDPQQSFIAFYPSAGADNISYKLYLNELYNLKLSNTELVILSACESGAGELVHGEGVMSLSRAFSYAGCDNIITSMWKADDASTAYIITAAHQNLEKGYSIAKALQIARMKYLNDEQVQPSQKQPAYWAHLRFIGDFQEHKNDHTVWYVLALVLAAIGGVIIVKSRKRIYAPASQHIN